MSDLLINFEDMDWERPASGVRQIIDVAGRLFTAT